MQVLIAHSDPAARLALRRVAGGVDQGCLDVVELAAGHETLTRLLAEDSPALALVEWDLPQVDGPELCRLATQFHEAAPPYIILLDGAGHDLAEGLDAGAGDCVRAPVGEAELRARIEAGRRIASLLAHRERSQAAVSLVAQRTPFDDEDDCAVSGRCELASVLVAE